MFNSFGISNASIIQILVVVGIFIAVRFLLTAIYAPGNQDNPLLLQLMKREGFRDWYDLQIKAGLSFPDLWLLRNGNISSLKWSEINRVAGVFSLSLGEFLEKLDLLPENPQLAICHQECLQLQNQLQQLTQDKEILHQEGLRLHSELQQQRRELKQEFRQSTFTQLKTLLTNYPSIQQMVGIKPELPAKNLLSMFTPVDNLLSEWGYEPIGKPWEQVAYNPQFHQPDAADIAEGESVYIRFVGYHHQGNILCPAKVSRTLPGGGKTIKN